MGLLFKTKSHFSDNQWLTIYKNDVKSQMEYCSPGSGSVAINFKAKYNLESVDCRF